MANGYRYRTTAFSPYGFFPVGVKWLLITNISIFVVNFLAQRFAFGVYFYPFGLVPAMVVHLLAVWQLVTYMFLHDPNGFGHILFNMLTLWMFGADLERTWGTRRFLQYYFLCGIGAGICVVLANLLFGNMASRTIGASGAIYGLLLAFGILYPDREVLLSFLFPIKAKYFVLILGAIAFLSSISASDNGVSHVAHLGGMVFGYVYLKSRLRLRFDPFASLRQFYQAWKLERARRKFQVYIRKQGSGRDRWVQ
jgi:membrane associated rhomboid family serine protease